MLHKNVYQSEEIENLEILRTLQLLFLYLRCIPHNSLLLVKERKEKITDSIKIQKYKQKKYKKI